MLRRLIALLVIVALAGGSPALADFNRSMKWFEGLSDEAKVDIQSNLVLLAHYGAFVDGEFGPSTYRAIVAFQESSGGVATGELTETQLTLLSNASEAVVTSLGIEFVRDPRAGLAIAVPVGILPNRQQTENGSLFLNADGSFTLEVFGVPDGDTTLGGMFAYANRNDPGRRVTYSVLREERYVVSGIDDGHYFYEMGFPLVGQTSGFRYRYPGTERYVGGIVSVYSASYVLPLALLDESSPPTVAAQDETTGERFGAFLAPAGIPDVLILDGDIVASTPLDLRRALRAQPQVKKLLLNSAGGSVYSGLLVAHDVHDLGLSTEVPDGFGCYSACAYIFFGGTERALEGELGVHQISSDVPDLGSAQVAISDILDALGEFGVDQQVVSLMLRTSAESMHVFTEDEVAKFRLEVAPQAPTRTKNSAYVVMDSLDTEAGAKAVAGALSTRFPDLLGPDDVEVIPTVWSPGVVRYRVAAPRATVSLAHQLCADIRAAGGACFISEN